MNWSKFFNVVLWFFGGAFNIALVVVVVLAVYHLSPLGAEVGAQWAYDLTAQGPDYRFEFVLEEDTPVAEVARQLEELGIVRNANVFMVERFMTGSVDYYRAGTYILNFNMSTSEIHSVLRRRQAGLAEFTVVTIPEGWNVRQIANYFEERGFFSADEFIRVANEGHFSFDFLRDVPPFGTDGRLYRLEGYLFPDTYHVTVPVTPGGVITQMLTQFANVFDNEKREQAYDLGMSIDEIVNLAAIIEMETRVAAERALVSQVVHSRLGIGMNLGLCSTVAYVLDVRRDRLLLVDLEIQSPFNTYRNVGLPVGPIANPGRAALNAALNPRTDTTYLFFVLRDPATGAHHFSHTYAEHRAADARYRQD